MIAGWDTNKNKWDSERLRWGSGGPTEVWTSHFDNTEWDEVAPGAGFWNGTQWEAEDQGAFWGIIISDIGAWASGYRPSKMRVTFTGVGSIGSFAVQDDAAGSIGGVAGYVSLDDIVLTFGANDGFKITAAGPLSVFYITNIEFT